VAYNIALETDSPMTAGHRGLAADFARSWRR
jgi:hypothetical protein